MTVGLKTLTAHIGLAMSRWSDLTAYNSGEVSEDPDQFAAMLRGIHRYQNASRTQITTPELTTIWSCGGMTLGKLSAHIYRDGARDILLVPSLVNHSRILNLLPECSFMEFLAAQNLNPYLLDWGDPKNDSMLCNLDDAILRGIIGAVDFLYGRTGEKVHAFGYCMGGTLLLAAAQLAADKIDRVVLQATPWDFHGGDQRMLSYVKFWAPSCLPSVHEKGFLAAEQMQALFASIEPERCVKKFARFMAMPEGSPQEKLFIAVGDWLNDGMDLPRGIAQPCVQSWYLNNITGAGNWSVGGQIIDPHKIHAPTLLVTSATDVLVEFESAVVLKDMLRHAHMINPACGHVGMITGRNARAQVWDPIVHWLQSHVAPG